MSARSFEDLGMTSHAVSALHMATASVLLPVLPAILYAFLALDEATV